MKEKSRVTIICAIITAVAGIIAGGSQIELKNAQTASQEINVNIIQTLDETGNSNLSLSTDLSSSTDELITAYKKAVNDSDELKMQAQSDQAQIRDLEDENSDLKNQVQILKAALLSTYSSDEISAVIEQGGLKKAVTKRLDNLECLDSVQCRQVASVKDLYGTTHSVSYRFEASSDAAWAKFKLDGKYDTFTASIVTADDTNRDSNMSVEVYVDDVLVVSVRLCKSLEIAIAQGVWPFLPGVSLLADFDCHKECIVIRPCVLLNELMQRLLHWIALVSLSQESESIIIKNFIFYFSRCIFPLNCRAFVLCKKLLVA